MNQKGEAILFCVLILVILSGLFTLCGLELERSFSQLQTRTTLFLCAKETKTEFKKYMTLMGRSNWALKHLSQAQLVAMMIPGLQGVALKASKLKKALKTIQHIALGKYILTLKALKLKGCPVNPEIFQTPFYLSGLTYRRDQKGAAIIRKKQWTYPFMKNPYLLNLKINATQFEAPFPKVYFTAQEKREMSYSPFFSP